MNCVLSAAEANMCDGDQPLTGEYIARARSRRRNIQPVQHQVRYLSRFCIAAGPVTTTAGVLALSVKALAVKSSSSSFYSP